LLLVIITADVKSDYSSLSKTELERVQKALAQAEFYPVYSDLVAGKDKLTIKKVEKIAEVLTDKDTYQSTFRYTVVLHINKYTFERVFENTVVTKVDSAQMCGGGGFWAAAGDFAIKFGSGFLGGMASGLAMCK
jgi:hypothetical protein